MTARRPAAKHRCQNSTGRAHSVLLRLRWALRDAKARWVQVAGIALMIAIGTGLYAGLSSVTQWRIASNEASLDLTNMYDLRARLAGDGHLPQGSLEEIARSIGGVEAAEERLIAETQVEVSTDDGPIFVPGRIIGVDLSNGGPYVNGVEVIEGRQISDEEMGQRVVLMERNFGVYYELPAQGELRLGDGVPARYVVHAVSPEYFIVVEEGSFFGQANLLVLFMSMETAQGLAGKQELVNDLVLTVEPGTDLADVETRLLAEIAERHSGAHLELMRTEDDQSYVALTRDPEGDQQFYNVIAVILFGGAAFAALNFAARMVESQRREIGTSMALGVSPLAIAVRPLLVGLQIGGLGVVFGVGMGLLIASLMEGVLSSFVALPVFLTPFQSGIFARVALVGFLIPVVAVLWPVLRATFVRPVEAIKTGHLASRGGGLAPIISRLPLPGSSLGRMPFRNLLRAPRRTLLTLFALTAVIGILFSIVGVRDSFLATLSVGDEELLRGEPNRLSIQLDSFYPIDSREVAETLGSGVLKGGETGLSIAALAHAQEAAAGPEQEAFNIQSPEEVAQVLRLDGVNLNIQFIDFDSNFWRPTASEGRLSVNGPGIVLARKAAADLGAGVGDRIRLTHPLRAGPGAFTIAATSVPVIAIHPHPLRFNAYMDIRYADLAGLQGFTNVVTGAPADGRSLADVKREMFGVHGVATVRGFSEASVAVQDAFEQVSAVFWIIELFVLGLALLIAFNTANINTDERARDHATMFAYGVPVGRVVLNLAVEGLMLGIVATALGIVLGLGLLTWMIVVLFPASYPDMGVIMSVELLQMAGILAGGIAVVALAPALTVRKLRRMDIPGTLRVLE